MRPIIPLVTSLVVLTGSAWLAAGGPALPEVPATSRRPTRPPVLTVTEPAQEPGRRRRRVRPARTTPPETASEHGKGGHRAVRARGKGCHVCPTAVDPGLEYFQAEQGARGGWGRGDPAVSGAVLLTYLGYGETHRAGAYKDVVKQGLRFLKGGQAKDGWFASADGSVPPGRGAVATLAMTEAYGLTQSRLFKVPAQRATDAVATALVNWTGWFRSGDSWLPDVEASTWSAMVLVSARAADLKVREGVLEEALHALRQFGNPGDPMLSLTDAARLCAVRSLLGDRAEQTPDVAAGVARLKAATPLSEGERADPEYIYFGTLACFRAGGEAWKAWNAALKEHVLPRLDDEGDSPTFGLWTLPAELSETERLYASALLQLTVQVYYRYGRVFGVK